MNINKKRIVFSKEMWSNVEHYFQVHDLGCRCRPVPRCTPVTVTSGSVGEPAAATTVIHTMVRAVLSTGTRHCAAIRSHWSHSGHANICYQR